MRRDFLFAPANKSWDEKFIPVQSPANTGFVGFFVFGSLSRLGFGRTIQGAFKDDGVPSGEYGCN